jgi:hypothetical protein
MEHIIRTRRNIARGSFGCRFFVEYRRGICRCLSQFAIGLLRNLFSDLYSRYFVLLTGRMHSLPEWFLLGSWARMLGMSYWNVLN